MVKVRDSKEKSEKKEEIKQEGINNGEYISLDYEGRLESGEIFDSSKHEDHSHPLEFQVGGGQVIPGFETAVLGMKKGEEKEFSIDPERAYGQRNEKLIQKVPRNAVPSDQEPKAGMTLVINTPNGQKFPVKIIDVDKDFISLDLNHPLAGKKLIFKIKILEIKN